MADESTKPTPDDDAGRSNFIRQIIDQHRDSGRYDTVVTRFPPEPNGYLHIGHAKSICLNFGIGRDYDQQAQGGPAARTHLRFDDTNPTKEDTEYVEAIQEDIRWLGFDWGEHLYYASDRFERFYELACDLIDKGLAYVDSQPVEAIREQRGTLTEAGSHSPFRDRSVADNRDLFRRMRAGEFPDGAHVLRAKIDMANPNMLMRDPVLYRILHAHHHQTGDQWCIYPMYDFAHCLTDAMEGITHSICTLEFENNRELYDWLLDQVWHVPSADRPHQYEFARLSLAYTMMSKRKLLQLVVDGDVSGWDDPRMPTIRGLRRRGYTPESIRAFCDMIGVAKSNSMVDMAKLEFCIRDDLNHKAPRVMAVLDPLEVRITNFPEAGTAAYDQMTAPLDASLWPHDVPREGTRPLHFSSRLFIERSDFMAEPVKGFRRLAPGREVRLRYGYVVRCDAMVHDDAGKLVAIECTVDPETRGGKVPTEGPKARKVKGTVHWVSAEHAVPCEVRLYDRLFTVEQPDAAGDGWKGVLNPESLVKVTGYVEPHAAAAEAGSHWQFERTGFFVADTVDSVVGKPVFNRVVTLKDSWARKQKAPQPAKAPAPKPAAKKADTGRKRPDKKGPSKDAEREAARQASPELAARFAAYQQDLGLSTYDADLLTGDATVADFFEVALTEYGDAKAVANWVLNEVLRVLKDKTLDALPFDGKAVGQLAMLVGDGVISSTAGKQVMERLVTDGGDPAAIVDELGLKQVSDASVIDGLVADVLAANAAEVDRHKSGAKNLTGFFIGQVMKASKGQANPQLVRTAVAKALS